MFWAGDRITDGANGLLPDWHWAITRISAGLKDFGKIN